MLEHKEESIQYLISKHLLKRLLNNGMITKEEFEKIDIENKRTFK